MIEDVELLFSSHGIKYKKKGDGTYETVKKLNCNRHARLLIL